MNRGDAQREAWKKRRAKFGPRGHAPFRFGHGKQADHPQFKIAYHELSEEQRRKSVARAYANVYQKRGLLKPKPCEDCSSEKVEKVEKHHADYSKPLDVTWLCRPCHLKRHDSVVSRETGDHDGAAA